MGLDQAPRLIELASGFDALYLSGSCVLPGRLLEDLQVAQDLAREASEPETLCFGRESFLVGERGINRYRFSLTHPNGVLAFTQSAKLPPVFVQPRARFIHAVGAEEAADWFIQLVESIVGETRWRVSRADLFMDSHGWDLSAEDYERFVGPTQSSDTYRRKGSFTGFTFGGGGALSARVYDKTHEVASKGTAWWTDVWGDAYRPSERVLRVEFQVRRSIIRQLGLDTPEDVLRHSPRVWAYLTDKWLSFRDPTSDKTRSRWPVSSEWQAVRSASFRGAAVGLDRVYAQERATSLQLLLPGLRGYLSSAGAIAGASSLEETLHRVRRLIELDSVDTGVPFEQRLVKKAEVLGLAS